MLVAFSVSPAGGDEDGSVGVAVAEAVRVVRASGLPNETNAMFTNLEGEWDEVMAVVKQAVEAVAAAPPQGESGVESGHPARSRGPAHGEGTTHRGRAARVST